MLILLPLACNFHPLSTSLEELSKTHQVHLSRLNGPQRITSRHRTLILGLKRKDENDNSTLFLEAMGFSFSCWLKRKKKVILNTACPKQRKILYIEVIDSAFDGYFIRGSATRLFHHLIPHFIPIPNGQQRLSPGASYTEFNIKSF